MCTITWRCPVAIDWVPREEGICYIISDLYLFRTSLLGSEYACFQLLFIHQSNPRLMASRKGGMSLSPRCWMMPRGWLSLHFDHKSDLVSSLYRWRERNFNSILMYIIKNRSHCTSFPQNASGVWIILSLCCFVSVAKGSFEAARAWQLKADNPLK